MGLDMYMSRKIYVGAQYKHNNITGTLSLQKAGKPIKIDLSKIDYIEESIGYWRKANAIHQWFVQNVQDGEDNCGEYSVSKEQMTQLLESCKKVLKASKLVAGVVKNGEELVGGVWVPIPEEGKNIEDSSVAEEELPTTSGFFFGGTDYDEGYYEDIKYTAELLDKILKEDNPDKDYFEDDYKYSSSW